MKRVMQAFTVVIVAALGLMYLTYVLNAQQGYTGDNTLSVYNGVITSTLIDRNSKRDRDKVISTFVPMSDACKDAHGEQPLIVAIRLTTQ